MSDQDERDRLRQIVAEAIEALTTQRWENARKTGLRFDEARVVERDLRIGRAVQILRRAG